MHSFVETCANPWCYADRRIVVAPLSCVSGDNKGEEEM